ncbi:5-carboxymethyl-2-hydroxymuconate Delta-isomerase [Achromobacter sp. Marseille-Q4962]|uniref:5-carboxymethyl-2-hydroxymuconate Delta-isomerase n=1 Tax=Achromobacter sp. Marseille-Q4962 TaxID=2942202 RepID=UPI0020735A33|nr:5-carboxymethyl-2-hydroxymuconate Delta-isomerase [Achromobacter sp. Marseille-Q4962]
MPHLTIEYSTGAFHPEDEASVLGQLNEAVIATGAITKESDLKTRMIECRATRVGTQDLPRGFVYGQLRLLPGRSPEVRSELTQRIADVLRQACRRPEGVTMQLSVEIVEMEKSSYVKETL